ncbi:MAG TPA: DEAD/DEAH box helicase [Polyangiaceae bacterium]
MQTDLFEAFRPPEPPKPRLAPRPYQEAARLAVELRHAECRGTLVVLPTGTGKSFTAGMVIWDWKSKGQKVLILCPTIVLCQQMYDDLRGMGLRPTIEQSSNRADRTADVVVASVATMRGDRLRSWTPTTFGLVIADEAHRSTSDMYAEIFAHFGSAKLLGLTATPSRADGVALGNVFDTTAFEMPMLQAINDGWLVPLRIKTAVTDFDPKRLRTIAGEVSAGSVAQELVRSGSLREAASTLSELADGSRTVAFLPTVASSQAFVGELIDLGVKAAHVDGNTDDETRDDVFKRFKAGELRVLSNVAVLTEGWNMPEASVIALLNPTKSWARITQMIGRGTRLSPGKSSVLVIDFCPGRMKKGRLASPADALAGKMLPDNVHVHLAKEGNLAEVIAQAEKTADDIEEKKRQARERSQRQAERTAELAKLAKAKAFTYGVQDHDALDILGGNGRGASSYSSGDVEVTEEERRRKEGLCSPKQAKILAKHGLDPNMKWRKAREAIDAIAANGWKLPDHIRDDKRFYPKGEFPGDKAAKLLEELSK